MKRYKIAGLIVEMNLRYNRLKNQAEPYLYEGSAQTDTETELTVAGNLNTCANAEGVSDIRLNSREECGRTDYYLCVNEHLVSLDSELCEVAIRACVIKIMSYPIALNLSVVIGGGAPDGRRYGSAKQLFSV